MADIFVNGLFFVILVIIPILYFLIRKSIISLKSTLKWLGVFGFIYFILLGFFVLQMGLLPNVIILGGYVFFYWYAVTPYFKLDDLKNKKDDKK